MENVENVKICRLSSNVKFSKRETHEFWNCSSREMHKFRKFRITTEIFKPSSFEVSSVWRIIQNSNFG